MRTYRIIGLALALVLGLSGFSCVSTNSPWNGDDTVFSPHREDFSPEIACSVSAQFDHNTELKKAYVLRTNSWFLSDDLSDFSQAVTTDVVYVVPGGEPGTIGDKAYSFYRLGADGRIEWNSSAYPPEDAVTPYGFSGLTYEIIEKALSEIVYQDYIITYAQRLGAVFVWVRCADEDVILTYPTRPDLLGIDIGGIYTLREIRRALTAAYQK